MRTFFSFKILFFYILKFEKSYETIIFIDYSFQHENVPQTPLSFP